MAQSTVNFLIMFCQWMREKCVVYVHNLNRISWNEPSVLTPYNGADAVLLTIKWAHAQVANHLKPHQRCLDYMLKFVNWHDRTVIGEKSVVVVVVAVCVYLCARLFSPLTCLLNSHYALTARILFHWNVLNG